MSFIVSNFDGGGLVVAAMTSKQAFGEKRLHYEYVRLLETFSEVMNFEKEATLELEKYALKNRLPHG